MTLNTSVFIRGPIDGPTAFRLALQAVLTVDGEQPGALDTAETKHTPQGSKWWANHDQIMTVPDQGLPAWTFCDYMADGSPIAETDQYDDDDDDGRYLTLPACQVEVRWDTAYGYQRPHLRSAAALHGAAIVWLHEHLPQGCSLVWRDEFDGSDHEGLTGLEQFTASGVEARQWFLGTVLPAVACEMIAKDSNQ